MIIRYDNALTQVTERSFTSGDFEKVDVTHGDVSFNEGNDFLAEVSPEAFAAMKDKWFEPVSEAPADVAEDFEPPFDPAGKSVKAILAHFETADAAEVERVQAIEAETDSPRKGVMEFVPADTGTEGGTADGTLAGNGGTSGPSTSGTGSTGA